jgi:hypothetical protein
MQNKKLITIPLLLVFALAAIGFAYAQWSKTLYINGTANTGELDWEFIGASCLDTSGNDYHCRDGFTGPPPFYWMGDKNVGSTGVTITDPHTATVTLTNVYPSYFTSVDVDAQNTGTIPLIIDRVVIDGNVLRKSPTPVIKLDLSGDGINDVEIKWTDGFGTQLNPGDLSPTMTFWIHILQGAPQSQTLSFTIEIVAIQWNEYVPPP